MAATPSVVSALKRPGEAAAPEEKRHCSGDQDSYYYDIRTFFSQKPELRQLSNFAQIPVVVGNIEYPTGEHCFQAHKYLHAAEQCGKSARSQELYTYAEKFQSGGAIDPDGSAAKRAGGKEGMPLEKAEMNGWTGAAEAIQLLICRSKKPQVRFSLLETGDAYLLHQDNRATDNTLWGGRIPDLNEKLGKKRIATNEIIGQNKLGLIWMKLRAEWATSYDPYGVPSDERSRFIVMVVKEDPEPWNLNPEKVNDVMKTIVGSLLDIEGFEYRTGYGAMACCGIVDVCYPYAFPQDFKGQIEEALKSQGLKLVYESDSEEGPTYDVELIDPVQSAWALFTDKEMRVRGMM